jgi:hypothetical protein
MPASLRREAATGLTARLCRDEIAAAGPIASPEQLRYSRPLSAGE